MKHFSGGEGCGRKGSRTGKRIRGALGIASWDSFGMPVEMWSREKLLQSTEEFGNICRGMIIILYPRGFKACEVTDDTINTILVIDMLSGSGGQVDPGKFMELLKAWAETSSKSNTVIGPSTAKAMEKIAAGVPMEETGVTGTTNGAAMKILPIGLLHEVKDLDDLIEDVRRLCLPTHNTSPPSAEPLQWLLQFVGAANIRSTRMRKTEKRGQSADKKLEEMLGFARRRLREAAYLEIRLESPFCQRQTGTLPRVYENIRRMRGYRFYCRYYRNRTSCRGERNGCYFFCLSGKS